MNKFHRYINLPFDIQKPSFMQSTPTSVVHKNLDTNDSFEMDAFLNQFGLCLVLSETFFTPPNGGRVPVHTDYTTYDTDFVKINKTWGPEDGKIVWYKSDKTFEYELSPRNIREDGVEVEYDNVSRITAAHLEDCTEVYSANTNKTSLVNTGCLHGTINPSNEPRWTMCYVPAYLDKIESRRDWYDACVKWNDAIKIFEDYLE